AAIDPTRTPSSAPHRTAVIPYRRSRPVSGNDRDAACTTVESAGARTSRSVVSLRRPSFTLWKVRYAGSRLLCPDSRRAHTANPHRLADLERASSRFGRGALVGLAKPPELRADGQHHEAEQAEDRVKAQ